MQIKISLDKRKAALFLNDFSLKPKESYTILCSIVIHGSPRAQSKLISESTTIEPETLLKERCPEDFAVLGQFCAKIITLRL